jgi:hypothetical protein
LKKLRKRHVTLGTEGVVDLLRCNLLGIPQGSALTVPPKDDFFLYEDFDEKVYKWGKEWMSPGLTTEKRDAMTKKLSRMGLGENHRWWFYSFCRGNWQESECTEHCDVCEECNDWREWRCKVW